MEVSVVNSMIACQQRSPLFPYTTLFRSRATVGLVELQLGQLPCVHRAVRLANASADNRARRHRHSGDRKSTRLNSSHVAISYAVFCLKKKINAGMDVSVGKSRKAIQKRT